MDYIVRWTSRVPPSRKEIEKIFGSEDLRPYSWSNGPGDTYGIHHHPYHKVLYCLEGSIVFKVNGRDVELRAGDRLDLPAGTPHSAVVGSSGVVCLEASRSD